MPREAKCLASKKNNWEKDRRERFNKAFDELSKVLPGYIPAVNISRIDILTKSTSTILELKEEISKLTKPTDDKQSYTDGLIKKLQDRIKKLLLRNEQLVQIFKDAGITIPKVFGTKSFKRPQLYSQIHKKIPAREQQKENDPEKSKVEKENRSTLASPTKKKTKVVPSNQAQNCAKTSNKAVRPHKPKKCAAKSPHSSNLVVLFSRLPTVPEVNQQFVLLQNSPVVNTTKSTALRKSSASRSLKAKKRTAKNISSPTINPPLSTLGPGTLILANGNVLSLVTQPQIMVPPIPLNPINTVVHPLSNINKIVQKNQTVKIKPCVTNTTQINKIPIPALTSKYANTSILKKCQDKVSKSSISTKSESIKRTAVKRKIDEKPGRKLKKSKSCGECQKLDDNTNKNVGDGKIVSVSSETVQKKTTEMSEVVVTTTETVSTVPTSEQEQVPTTSDNLIKETAAVAEEALKLMDEVHKSDKSANDSNDVQKEVISSGQKEDVSNETPLNNSTSNCVLLVSSVSSTISCSTPAVTVSCTTTSITAVSNTINDENMKNIDLNLHSDLSNDIFASLQVPPGCQNMESTSPTAAFLLAFPLVSSIKVTEVIDEDNSDSQRETPTLLQIGMDNNSKPSNNEALLGLENFSFFNSKDIYYNSKLENSTTEENRTEKNGSVNPEMSSEETKTKSNSNNHFEVFSKPADNHPSLNQSDKENSDRFMLFEQNCKNNKSNLFEQTDSCNMMNLNAFQGPTDDLPGVLEQKNSLHRKDSNTEEYNALIQENMMSNNINATYNMSDGNLCKQVIPDISFKDCKTSNVNLVNNITPQDATSGSEILNNTFNAQNNVSLNNFSSSASKMAESTNQALDKPSDVSKTFQYTNKHMEQAKTFSMAPKAVEKPTQSLEKMSSALKMELYRFPVLQNDHMNHYEPLKDVGKLENKTRDNFNYHTLQNEDHVNNFSSKLLENPVDNVQKTDTNKERNTYHYNPKPFLQNEHNLNMFSTNSVKLLERDEQSLEKSDKSKSYQYNHKQFVPGSTVGTFDSTSSKIQENVTQSLDKPTKTYHYTNNPFEIVPAKKEVPLNIADSCNVKDRQKSSDGKGIEDACAKTVDEKACYFSKNYSSTSYRPTSGVVPSDSSKMCHSGSYATNQKNYTNPFYTNCNYNYSDTSFNQNYYKTDKSCYSLNYENYQEYRKSDTTFNRDRRNSTTKDKPVLQNKPVNWMTTTEQKTSDCFLPTFTNQSYSFSSCINTESEINPLCDTKKSTDFSDKRFTWSPSKLPNFLEPSHNFITPTLPTLVGDLALGNALPLTEPKNEYKCPKEVKRKTYDSQANFLSVSQLVNQNKPDPTPVKTMSRRLSGSKSTKTSTNKLKRCDKVVDKSAKPVNTYSDVFYDQKNRTSTKNISSNYSAEALIGNQCPQEEKKYPQNIGTYFPAVDDSYANQNQNFHSYSHNSFQNNSYSTNSFIYTTPISTNYLNNTFDNTSDYSAESIMNYNKNCGNKNNRAMSKEDKNTNYAGSSKKPKKTNQTNSTSLGNFEYPLLPIQGSTNSPLLPDDFQAPTTFLPPTTPYPCKNSLYQKQGNDFNTAPLLPIPGITRAGIQHPEVSPSLNHVGTSLTNFNLSTIFPEINKGTIPNIHTSSNKSKNTSSYLHVPFNTEPKYGFPS